MFDFNPASIAELDSQVADEFAYAIDSYRQTTLLKSLKKSHMDLLTKINFGFPPNYNTEQKKAFFINWLNLHPKYKRNNMEEILEILSHSSKYGQYFKTLT